MTARQAIKTELNEIRDKIKGLQHQEQALASALAALNGSGSTSTPGRRVRDYDPARRKPLSERQTEVEDWLRGHPNLKISAHQVANNLNAATASIATVMERLEEAGKVAEVDETTRGKPIYQYRPTTVKPGEEVKG